MKKSYYLFFSLLLTSSSAIAQVDYESQIQAIFSSKCVSCHGGSSGLTLSSYEALFASTGAQYGTSIVVPGNVGESGLVDKIEPNPQFGVQMPQGGAALPQSSIDLIKQWISEGANAVPTSNEEEMVIPDNFRLIGNYPNPFNPSTQVRFDTPEAIQYTISIYSVHGQLVAEQVGNVSAGRANVAVNLGANPTGMYIYRVKAQSNGIFRLIGTGRMTLIK